MVGGLGGQKRMLSAVVVRWHSRIVAALFARWRRWAGQHRLSSRLDRERRHFSEQVPPINTLILLDERCGHCCDALLNLHTDAGSVCVHGAVPCASAVAERWRSGGGAWACRRPRAGDRSAGWCSGGGRAATWGMPSTDGRRVLACAVRLWQPRPLPQGHMLAIWGSLGNVNYIRVHMARADPQGIHKEGSLVDYRYETPYASP